MDTKEMLDALRVADTSGPRARIEMSTDGVRWAPCSSITYPVARAEIFVTRMNEVSKRDAAGRQFRTAVI
jgi:hypothetical protein